MFDVDGSREEGQSKRAEATPRVRALLLQARRVAARNKRHAARELFRQITAEAPELVDGWLGLAEVAEGSAEAQAAYEKVVALDAGNATARAALARLAGAEEPGTDAGTTAPLPSSPAEPFADARSYFDEVFPGERRKAAPAPPEADPPELVVDLSQGQADPGLVRTDGETLYCYRHPNRETTLRCNRCGKPICTRCARPTPVGYRCVECVREQEDIFFTATPLHYLLAAAVSFPLAILGAVFAPALGFWVIFAGPLAGSIIGRITFRLAGRRRGRWLPHLVAGIVVVSALLVLLFTLGSRLLWVGVYTFMAASSAFYQMK